MCVPAHVYVKYTPIYNYTNILLAEEQQVQRIKELTFFTF